MNRLRSVKYIGVLKSDGLNWKPHIKKFLLELSKSSAIIFCFRNFVNTETFELLYYRLVYSRVQYGIILWGTAAHTRQKEIALKLTSSFGL